MPIGCTLTSDDRGFVAIPEASIEPKISFALRDTLRKVFQKPIFGRFFFRRDQKQGHLQQLQSKGHNEVPDGM